MKLLAIVGSQRKSGNSYLLAKETLKSTKADYKIIQLAEKKIEYCDLCGKCETGDCVLNDDFNQILENMEEADGIIFSFPKYLSLPSKFLCFLERLAIIHHCKEYHGLRKTGITPDPNFSPLFKGKLCCLFVVSGSGKGGEEPLRIVVHEIERTGMKLILHDSQPFLGVAVKGEDKEEVLKDRKGIEDCGRIIKKLIESI